MLSQVVAELKRKASSLRAGFPNRETEDAETVGAEKSTPVVRQRTLRPRHQLFLLSYSVGRNAAAGIEIAFQPADEVVSPIDVYGLGTRAQVASFHGGTV
jgi:hypothetical protein